MDLSKLLFGGLAAISFIATIVIAAFAGKVQVIAQRVFGNPNHFYDFLMQHAVRFEA